MARHTGCPICDFLEKSSVDTIYDGDFFKVALNPRWSPHFGRTAIIPYEHLGEYGKYGLSRLNEEQKKELSYLDERTVNAIIKFSNHTDSELKKRDGLPCVEHLIRPSVHPNLDLIPQYKKPPNVGGYIAPRYLDDEIEPGSSEIKKAEVIVASFPKKEMPRELRAEIVSILKDFF